MNRKTAIKLIIGGGLIATLRARAEQDIRGSGSVATLTPFKDLPPDAQKAYAEAGVTKTWGDDDAKLKLWQPPEEVSFVFSGVKRIKVEIAGKTHVFTVEEIAAALG